MTRGSDGNDRDHVLHTYFLDLTFPHMVHKKKTHQIVKHKIIPQMKQQPEHSKCCEWTESICLFSPAATYKHLKNKSLQFPADISPLRNKGLI